MNVIVNVDERKFSHNGITYLKNYISVVAGSRLMIFNCYEKKDVLVELTNYGQFSVNGIVYASAALLQAALLDVIYSRANMGEGTAFDQNNRGKTMSFTLPVGVVATLPEIVSRLNSSTFAIQPFLPFTVLQTQSPIVLTIIESIESVSKRYVYLFFGGKGLWGGNGPVINASQLFFVTVSQLTPEDIKDDPNAIINNLDPVVAGDFITKANQAVWDLGDSGEVQEDGGVRSYYFTYTDKGVLYFALFKGVPGIYGGSGTQFTADDFVISTNSSVTPDFNILDWKPGIYSENSLVTESINGQKYLFKSLSDNNTTEPLFKSHKPAWDSHFGGNYVGVWDNTTAFVTGNIVNREGYAYWCASNNTNTDPKILTYNKWIKLGKLIGAFSSGTIYKNGDVVTSGTNVLISNYDNNKYALDYGPVSKWEFINGDANTIVSVGDSMTEGIGCTGDGDYPSQLSKRLGRNVLNIGIAGETSTQIRTRFFQAPQLWHLSFIFWAGRNNAGDPTTVLADIAAMVAALPHDRYLVIGITKHIFEDNTQVDDLNAQLKAIYGDRFVDMQAYLLTIYDTSIPQDVLNHASGYLAWSILSDYLHLNNKGYYHVAKLIASRFLYLQGTPEIYLESAVFAAPIKIPNGILPGDSVNKSQLDLKANKNGSDATGTWGINITGNAGNSTLWNTMPVNLSSVSPSMDFLLGNKDNTAVLVVASGVKAWLSIAITDVSNLATSLSGKADLVGGTVPASQLPSYVDDVLEYANLAAFPATGESGKIYVANDTNLTYRWSGSSYVGLSISLALGETAGSAYRGDRGKIAYDHSQTTGNPHNTTISDIPGLTDALPVILKLTQNIDFPDLGSHSYSDLEIDFTGAVIGDCVEVFAPIALNLPRIYYTAWVSAADKVTVRITNTDTPSVVTPAGDFKLRIIK
jgi:lysophospholipase L1-like esterase